jgi:hydroxymethylpyrimidine/phosphomethylpyrimidine kinase
MAEARGRVLIIAGSDPSGGAGLQADLKTVTALGGYGAGAVTAITVQDTLGVHEIHRLPQALVEAQARAVLDDIGADAIKTGMLGGREIVEAVARILDSAGEIPAVIDPVMVAKGGASLLDRAGVDALRTLLIPRCALLTPNAPEAQALTALAVVTADDLRRAGEALLALGAPAVLMKGGHLAGETVTDVLMTADGETTFAGPRIDGRARRGTGCTLASACATGLAQGMTLEAAVARAWAYVGEAMRAAHAFGAGHLLLDHAWPLRGR